MANRRPTSRPRNAACRPVRKGCSRARPAVQHGQRLDQTHQSSEGGNRCLTATTQHARKRTTKTTICPLPTVDGLTDTAVTTSGLPTRLTELLAQRPGGSVGDTARAVTALEDAIRRESSDTLRSRLVAARALILDLPLAD